MKTRFIPALITLLAATCVSVINIINKTELVLGLKTLIVVIVIFYILGTIAKKIINNAITKDDHKTDKETTTTEEAATAEDSRTNDKADEKVE